ncbi:MAG: hypothetical protein Q9222_003574 [Ikaeria aurantiellina]
MPALTRARARSMRRRAELAAQQTVAGDQEVNGSRDSAEHQPDHRSKSQPGAGSAPPQNPESNTRRRRNASNHSRRRSNAPSFHSTGTGIRRERGFRLPRFGTPQWRIRARLPTLVLPVVDLFDPKDLAIDTQSDHSVALTDTPAAGEDFEHPMPISSNPFQDSQHTFALNVPNNPRDISPNEQNVWGPPEDGDIPLWGRKVSKFIRSPIGPEKDWGSGWRGVKPLGKGGFGVAGLWEKLDQDGKVIDRVVVKQIGAKHPDPWNPALPNEVFNMLVLRRVPPPTNCVGFRKYARYNRRELHRIYMEYCPYGDLRKLINQYRRKKYGSTGNGAFMPEPFIWHVFFQLTRACQALAAVRFEQEIKGEVIELDQMVHFDIKPENGEINCRRRHTPWSNILITLSVFLADEGKWPQLYYPFYAIPKLGDFGLSRMTGVADEGNPKDYTGNGTPGYRAFEQEDFETSTSRDPAFTNGLERYRRVIKRGAERDQILGPTNVWGIGAVMFELMTLKQAKYYLYQFGDEDQPHPASGDENYESDDDITWKEGIHGHTTLHKDRPYDRRLKDLVQKCLRPDPSERPKPQDLCATLQEIEEDLRDTWLIMCPPPDDPGRPRPGNEVPWDAFDTLQEGSWRSSPGQAHPEKLSSWRTTPPPPTPQPKHEGLDG